MTRAKVRRERMGHIELAAPVSHIWYFKGIPSKMGLILDMSPRALEKVLYFVSYVVLDPGDTPLSKKQVLNDREYHEYIDKYGNKFKAGMGAEAIKQLLQEIDLDKLYMELRSELKTSTGQKRVRLLRRLDVTESFRSSGNKPEWMILDVIPVIPPDLRPMVQLDGGRFATSDLNDLYRRVINRNNRLKRLLDLGAPDIIVRNEKRMLQEAVDALIDNGRRGRPVTGPGNRPLKSLSDMLKGKQGRFRQNLLGKRVDYSGRSVIVVGPELKFYQCGLPKEMALELFKPFVMRDLVKNGLAHNIKSAKRMVERLHPAVWDVLGEVIKDHPVLLNRAPTLHRLGIQAYQPILVEGKAIKLHPLACTPYNADFDGDQMAVHVPLSVEAQAEARCIMLSVNNILKPQDGKPVVVPTQDMILGCYYLTLVRPGAKGEGEYFSSYDEALMAYQDDIIALQSKIHVRVERNIDGDVKRKIIDTTVGKLIVNEAIPQDLGFVDRSDPDKLFDLEIDEVIDKKFLGTIVDKCFRAHGSTGTVQMLDRIKALGYKYATKAALTVSVSDMGIPSSKDKVLDKAQKKVDVIDKQYKRGLISNDERYERVIAEWTAATEEVGKALLKGLDRFNPIYMMADSGARGSSAQITQISGMRGLMANPTGKIIEMPIKSNFREGLTSLEYFISTHGARKGLADIALRTADSGYLTRRLVDVSQDVIVREFDCGTDDGVYVMELKDGNEVIEKLEDRLIGRVAAEDVVDPNTGEVLVKRNQEFSEKDAAKVVSVGITRVKMRSVMTCKSKHGVCAKCYGRNLASGETVNIGEAVGIIAAQSIGEPGTQLTMRTFHTGGIAGTDITQGLPRVEELFEARKPKGLAVIANINGTVSVSDNRKKREVTVTNNEAGDAKTYQIPYGARLRVTDGQYVEAGDQITEGSVYPQDLLKIKGIEAVENYLLQEVQRVYRLQGVEISDKHIEVIIRQMLRKVKIEDAGDTGLLPGESVDIYNFVEENEKAAENDGKQATGKRVLMGITKSALSTESFLSAASFQETTRVLTDAALKGKTDQLLGLKENVILGKLIPAGTGMSRYKNIVVKEKDETTKEEPGMAVDINNI